MNARQKLVVINISNGMSQTDAYLQVYGASSREAAQRQASALMRKAECKAYLNRLIEAKRQTAIKITANSIMSAQERKVRLSEIARAELTDFVDSDGNPKLDSNTPNKAAAREYYHRVRHFQDGGIADSKGIKLINPIEAIQELNKMDGSYAPNRSINESISFEIKMVTRPPKRDTEQDFIEPE